MSADVSPLSPFLASTGLWQGTNRLYNPETQQPEDTPSTLTLSALLDDRFLRIDYTWAFQETLQQGSYLLGYENEAQIVTLHWIDSWHMGDKVMVCRGSVGDQGTLSLLGSFAAPPGPDWGWRIELHAEPDQKITVAMFVISPEGAEYPAVEAQYIPV